MRILTICGSLRARSSNRAVLRAYTQLIGARAMVRDYENLGALPHFNPDLDGEEALPEAVAELRQLVDAADAIIISTPEYVHALPGSFKNVLDWLVSDPSVVGKPAVILHLSRGSRWALDSLREVLTTMSLEIIEPACPYLSLGTNRIDEEAILQRADLRNILLGSIDALFEALDRRDQVPLER